jgi:NhaA family Na+:H+ antiporter
LLWATVYAAAQHPTHPGVVLAKFIPTRPPPNNDAQLAHANAVIIAEARRSCEVQRERPSSPANAPMDAIHDRQETPADRMLRTLSMRSSYLVLPLFALANAGVALDSGVLAGRESLMLAIFLGLVVGKPLGLVSASALAVRLGIATKPSEYSWWQLAGAGSLAGIGFTMSLFIAGEALPAPGDFSAAKIAIFSASVAAAALGVIILWRSARTD